MGRKKRIPNTVISTKIDLEESFLFWLWRVFEIEESYPRERLLDALAIPEEAVLLFEEFVHTEIIATYDTYNIQMKLELFKDLWEKKVSP